MLQVSQQTRIRSDEGLTLETSASKFSLRYELSFLNYPVILSNQRGTTVSVEIYPFKHKLGILRRFYLNLISSNIFALFYLDWFVLLEKEYWMWSNYRKLFIGYDKLKTFSGDTFLKVETLTVNFKLRTNWKLSSRCKSIGINFILSCVQRKPLIFAFYFWF